MDVDSTYDRDFCCCEMTQPTNEEIGYKPNVRHIIFTPFISEVAGYILYGISRHIALGQCA